MRYDQNNEVTHYNQYKYENHLGLNIAHIV